MKQWYDHYESQCWYKNTFLVNNFSQISRAAKGNKEWNNIEDSGCNFVCLSMIIGINPAYLATKLMKEKFFRVDHSIRAIKLNGKTGYLVWDKNCAFSIKNIHHPLKGMVNVKIKFLKIEKAKSSDQATLLIKENRILGHHIICGYPDHSRLAAGIKNGNYFLWDPDLTETDISKNLSGEYSLNWFYDLYKNDKEYRNKAAEYWIYSVDMKKIA